MNAEPEGTMKADPNLEGKLNAEPDPGGKLKADPGGKQNVCGFVSLPKFESCTVPVESFCCSAPWAYPWWTCAARCHGPRDRTCTCCRRCTSSRRDRPAAGRRAGRTCAGSCPASGRSDPAGRPAAWTWRRQGYQLEFRWNWTRGESLVTC